MDTIPKDQQFNIILANINKHILLREMSNLGQQLTPGGVILISGLLREDVEDIEGQAVNNNLSVSGRTAKGSWICLKMEKSPN
jgi:ribosomal protein L11 methyltransferase